MSFVLEAMIEWVGAHCWGLCYRFQAPDNVNLLTTPECVYESLFPDEKRTWVQRVAYVAWLKAAYGPLKGFMVLCNIHQKRLR